MALPVSAAATMLMLLQAATAARLPSPLAMEQEPCWVFKAYHSSQWEQSWLRHASEWQYRTCDQMRSDVDLSQSWLSRRSTAHAHNHLPGNGTDAVFSHFEYVDTCRHQMPMFIPIEPLVGLLRHPFAHESCKVDGVPMAQPDPQEPAGQPTIEVRSYLFPHPVSARHTASEWPQRKVLLDMGCGRTWNSSLHWFVEQYRLKGVEFDEIFAWEAGATDAKAFWDSVPGDMVRKLHWYNTFVTDDFSSDANPVNIIAHHGGPGTMVVVKLDIDTEPLELAIFQALQERQLVDYVSEMYFERHFDIAEMRAYFGSGQEGKLQDTLIFFWNLRSRGLRLHYWP